MRSFWRILFGKRLTRHPDTFALTRESLWDSIAKSIRLQQSMGKAIWLVVHFPDTYLACQAMLEKHDIDYVVETDPVSETWFREKAAVAGPHVRLLLSRLVLPLQFENDEMADTGSRVAMMVVERHPYAPMDDQLYQFAESLPARMEVGYFLALDDEVVTKMVPREMLDLLKSMGMKDHELVTSSLVTRRLKKAIERKTETAEPAWEAESAADWFQLQSESG